MISLCILVRDTPNLNELISMFFNKYGGEVEVCIGDNSVDEVYRESVKALADVYVPISDKELFRMGIPWAHNRIASEANSYNIAYLDSDEYPLWINPHLDEMLQMTYIVPTIRYDFLTTERIKEIGKLNYPYNELVDYLGDLMVEEEIKERSIQDRFYNSRYVKFDGICHSVFHAPDHFRGNGAGAILLHNSTVRNKKDKQRMDEIIDEQFARQNINPYLASSPTVMQWGRGIEHKYANYNEFKNAHQ